MSYKTLDPDFLQAMDEIGIYGNEKYKEESFFQNPTRDLKRKTKEGIADHIFEHNAAYLRNEVHDHFQTLEHQLAAIAYNAMMEFHMARKEKK